jgi:hypothetical protein
MILPSRPRPGIVLRHGADKLPPRAKAKLATLTEMLEQAVDASQSAERRRSAASDDRARASQALELLLEHSGRVDPARVKAAQQAIETARAAEDRRTAIADEASAAAAPLQRLCERLRAYVETVDGDLKEASPVAVKASPAPAVQLHAVRLEIEKLLATRAAIAGAPPHDAEIIEGISAQVAELAARGRPLHVGQHGSTWPTQAAEVWADGRPAAMAAVPDAPAMMAWLFPEAMRERMMEQALAERRAGGVAPGLPRVERSAELARLSAAILDAERLEEALIEMLEAKGSALQRRETADVRAVLGIDGPPPAMG